MSFFEDVNCRKINLALYRIIRLFIIKKKRPLRRSLKLNRLESTGIYKELGAFI